MSLVQTVDPEKVLNDAITLGNGGHVKQAIQTLQLWLKNNDEILDENKQIRILLGVLLNKTGCVEEAIDIWKQGITDGPPYNHTAFQTTKHTLCDLLHLHHNHVICELITIFAVPNESDAKLHIRIAQRRYKQANDGPSVSYKLGSVCYKTSGKTDDEESEWIKEQADDAIYHYQKALNIIGGIENPNIYAEYANACEFQDEFRKAFEVWDDICDHYASVVCWVGSARCLYHLEKYPLAKHILENVAIKIKPNESEIYSLLAQVANKLELNEDYMKDMEKKKKFCTTVPEWLDLECNDINCDKLDALLSDDSNQCIDKLIHESTLINSKLLILFVNGHFNHGVESKVFNCLIDRIQNDKHDLIEYIRNMLYADSVCVIKGAANTLAELKDHASLPLICRLLPNDTNAFWVMNIANVLGKMQNYDAIPFLVNELQFGFINDKVNETEDDNDGISNLMIDSAGNRERCAIALGIFTDLERNENALKILTIGVQKAKTNALRMCCVMSLLNIYCTAVIQGNNNYNSDMLVLFDVMDEFLNVMKGNGVPGFVTFRLTEPLQNIYNKANKCDNTIIASKCKRILDKIEQESKEEALREEQQENNE